MSVPDGALRWSAQRDACSADCWRSTPSIWRCDAAACATIRPSRAGKTTLLNLIARCTGSAAVSCICARHHAVLDGETRTCRHSANLWNLKLFGEMTALKMSRSAHAETVARIFDTVAGTPRHRREAQHSGSVDGGAAPSAGRGSPCAASTRLWTSPAAGVARAIVARPPLLLDRPAARLNVTGQRVGRPSQHRDNSTTVVLVSTIWTW